MKAHFARYGIPEKLTTDYSPPFNAHVFAKFAQAYGFEHDTSSPGYTQANGKAENAVKLYKSTLTKAHHSGQDHGYLALLELSNTPSEILNSSPAQTVRKMKEDANAYCQIPVETFRCANWTWSTREKEKAGTLL